MAITLESLQRGYETEPPRLLLYGVPGIGKTTFATSAPNAVFLMTEKGKGALSYDSWQLKEWSEVIEAFDVLANEKHDFQTVVIDTLDWLEKLIFAQVCEDKKVESIEDIGYAKGYTFALKYWDVIIQSLDYLHEQKNMAIILLGHAVINRFGNPNGEDFDQYALNVHKKAAARITEWVPNVLFYNYDAKIKVTTEEFGKAKAKPVKQLEIPRVLYTQYRPAWFAKNRYNLPEEIPLPREHQFDYLMAAIEKGREEIRGISKQNEKTKMKK